MSDGGPAFARPSGEACDIHGNHFWPVAQEGMTLRDYFAASIVQGLVANNESHKLITRAGELPMCYAKTAYKIADAMIQAREK